LLSGTDLVLASPSPHPWYGHIWFLPLDVVATPTARLTLDAQWDADVWPADLGVPLTLSVHNAGPWNAHDVIVQLPPDSETTFTNVTVVPASLNAVRIGDQLTIPLLPPNVTASLTLGFAGRSELGAYAPSFSVAASSPSNPPPPAPVSPIIRIVEPPTLSVEPPAPVTEGDSGGTLVPVTLVLSPQSIAPVRLRLETVAGTATAGTDFNNLSTMITISAGLTQHVRTVGIRGDLVPEPTEFLTVRVSEVTGARIQLPEASIAILDNDLPSVVAGTAEVVEGDTGTTLLQVPIQMSFPPLEGARLQFATQGGFATPGADYLPSFGSLTFDANRTNATLTFTILGDIQPELDETFHVVWFGGQGVRTGTDTALVVIRNDDPLPEFLTALIELGTNVSLQIPSLPGASYYLERADDATGPWAPLEPPVMGTGGFILLIDPAPPETRALYRVRQEP
jgi:hypothetical protein